jgi:HEAT repeat protein
MTTPITSKFRSLMMASLLGLALASGACKEPDPNAFETHVENIKDSGKRATGFTGLEALVKTVVTSENKQARLDEFVTKVLPTLEEVWPDAPEQHEKILLMLRDAARPEASSIWNQALGLDGSGEARKRSILALEGIKKAKAVDSADRVREEFKKLIDNPKNDDGADEEGGRVRILMAETLGALRDKKAVDVLVESLMQPREKQPPSVHRAVATALGQIGDSSDKTVDALLTVTFRVPDYATSKNVGVRAKQALVAIGDPAIPKVIEMLKGKHAEVQKLAAQASAEEAGLNQFVIAQTAASILGGMGSPKALDALLEVYPKDDCVAAPPKDEKKKPEGEEAPEEGGVSIAFAELRAVVANAMGLIGDQRAVDVLCQCSLTSKNPGDMFEILNALGRIGGPKAVECLNTAMTKAEYTGDAALKENRLEARWESGRFAILAAGPDDIAKVEEAIAAGSATDAKVKSEMEAWKPGIEIAKKCKADKDCYVATLRDTNADWFAREKAAFEVAKLGEGDPAMALEIAKAYKVRNPDGRVSMAWLPGKMLRDKKCNECAAALEAVHEAEKLSTDRLYQAAVLLARDTIAKLSDDGAAEAAAPAKK